MFTPPKQLLGLRVLVAEDEMLVSMAIEEFLQDIRCEIVGPFSDVAPAHKAAISDDIDFGLLDINLTGDRSYVVAEALAARRTPFLFISGYGDHALPPDRPGWRVCRKPFRGPELAAMMIEQMERERVAGTRSLG